MKIVKGDKFHVELPDSVSVDLLVKILDVVLDPVADNRASVTRDASATDLNATQIWQLVRQLDRLEAELKNHGTTFAGSAFGRHLEALKYVINVPARLRSAEAKLREAEAAARTFAIHLPAQLMDVEAKLREAEAALELLTKKLAKKKPKNLRNRK